MPGGGGSTAVLVSSGEGGVSVLALVGLLDMGGGGARGPVTSLLSLLPGLIPTLARLIMGGWNVGWLEGALADPDLWLNVCLCER